MPTPVLQVIVGPNGAGKSTFQRSVLAPSTLEFVNADHIAAQRWPGLDRGFAPSDWLASYLATYLERDVRTITDVGDLNTFKRLVRMPKLHFYDSGLVCWLLGIREPGQLRSHPLRGALFETWVASEIVRHRTNRGSRGGVSHYRDRSGTEVDIVAEHIEGTEAGIALIEARATATPNSRLLDGPRRVRAYLADSRRDISAVAVYGGAETQHRSDGSLVAWDELHLSPPGMPA